MPNGSEGQRQSSGHSQRGTHVRDVSPKCGVLKNGRLVQEETRWGKAEGNSEDRVGFGLGGNFLPSATVRS